MAGDWIKMRCDLTDDPAVIGISAATDLDEFQVVGRLHKLWSWADRQSRDGNAPGVTLLWLNRYVDCEGFAEAMVEAGWLATTSTGISFPNFERHNGKPAKKRALTSRRVETHRKRNCNADGVTKTLPEKRREEKRSTGDSTSTARTEEEPPEKHPTPIDPNDPQGNTDPVSDLYRAFHTISAREPIPAGKRSEAPAIRQDAEALIARVGLERAKSLIEAKVLEQNAKHDPLSHVGAAIRFVMTDLNGQSETPIENGLEYEPNTHLMHPGLPPNVENAEAYL